MRGRRAGLKTASLLVLAMASPVVARAGSESLTHIEQELGSLRQQNESNQRRIKELEDTIRALKASPAAIQKGEATEAKAEEVRRRLLELQKEYIIKLGDAVIATKTEAGKIKLNDDHDVKLADLR